ncbi:MAG: hypothetical protein QHH06_02255 [Clostridiales bacterium]|nr:hypothetical protein [Eubacteriales bacterium]MDH7565295.1 hypothetical protein [Clostridiales bacterium]
MSNNIIYQRDLLYPTDNIIEPGSIHMEMLNPDKKGKIPVIIENRTSHSPIDYMERIIKTLQSEVFDRINIRIVENVHLYISLKGSKDLKKKYDNKKFLRVVLKENQVEYKGKDEIDE